MKSRGVILGMLVVMLSFSFVTAANINPTCNLEVTLLNQDPFPAIPGEEVKLVFQVDGVDNPLCGGITFEFVDAFPFKLETGTDRIVEIESGTHTSDFSSFLLAPFDVIVDEEALDGDAQVTVQINADNNGVSSTSYEIWKLDVRVEDVRVDFEVSIRDFEQSTNTITFEILNVGESDVEALTVEVPKQDNVEIKGSKRNIVGSLDSNEDTTFDFEAIPENGEIMLDILYTDETGVRRSLEKSVEFDSTYFEGRARDQNGSSTGYIIGLIVVIILVVWWWRARAKKKKRMHHARR